MQAERGMLDLTGDLARCCAAGCGWEGIPTHIRGKPSTHCPACERPDDEDVINAELDAAERRAAMPKVGRNEPCPCGSGRKFKKCCGA